MDLQNITIVSFGYFEDSFLRQIADAVRRQFAVTVTVKEGFLDMTEYYDASRRQYNGNLLMKSVDAAYGSEGGRTIGLFNIDLFIPILTFIFGLAYLNGRTGIVSVYRLGNERYGMDRNEDLLLSRTIKEVLHELGHTMGLIHCRVPDCVMRSVTYVEDIDQKEALLCQSCRKLISAAL